ncbi:MAG: ABC transporter ATP-binding protein [Gammaproteobacteria bacterium]|nr:MAG: ABC transporter ATP-binding protein [Gammaproteobacteria bacterium]
MNDYKLHIEDLSVAVAGQVILNNINLTLNEGELHVLLGANGCGKSSLLSSIMGLPPFEILSGKIHYHGQRIECLSVTERANLGIGMTFQRPPALDGVSLSNFVALMPNHTGYLQGLAKLDLNKLVNRDVNVGFSGGEIKRWEVLKVCLQDPQLLLFDEPESGVDLEHIMAIGEAINRLMQSRKVVVENEIKTQVKRSALVITHTGLILDYIQADVAHMMIDGRIVHSDSPRALFSHIKRHGYVLP